MDYGLALSGGGARGSAHIGILMALAEENMLPSSIAGTSAGSIIAGLYAANISIDTMQKIAQILTSHPTTILDPDIIGMLLFFPQFLTCRKQHLTGLLKGHKLNNFLCSYTDGKEISDLNTQLVIPAVDLISGNTIAFTNSKVKSPLENVVWKTNGKLCDIITASCSVPGIFRPVKMSKYYLVDGGVTHNLPVNLLMYTGVDKIIAVDIGVDYKTPHNNSITEILSHSFSIMSYNLKTCLSQGERLLLEPSLDKNAGLLTFNMINDCIKAGYIYGKKMIPKIKDALK